ncbi:MAG TPA: C80 family cysteine peptidase [Arsenophonus sp.]
MKICGIQALILNLSLIKIKLVKPKLAKANDRYNIIIQLEGEEIINKTAANLIGKHLNNTILIQYDLENNQYQLAHGDIDKVIASNSRWLLIGYDRFDEQKNNEYLLIKVLII